MKTIFKIIKDTKEVNGTDADMFNYQLHPKNYEVIERGCKVNGDAVVWLLILKYLLIEK